MKLVQINDVDGRGGCRQVLNCLHCAWQMFVSSKLKTLAAFEELLLIFKFQLESPIIVTPVMGKMIKSCFNANHNLTPFVISSKFSVVQLEEVAVGHDLILNQVILLDHFRNWRANRRCRC